MRSLASRLCFCVMLPFMAHIAAAQDATPKASAILLTARPALPDPNFKDSVLLVANNLGDGPIGVILNRPTSVAVRRVFPEIESLRELEDKIYFGGPVGLGVVSF